MKYVQYVKYGDIVILVSFLLTLNMFPCSSVSIVNFEQVNTDGELGLLLVSLTILRNNTPWAVVESRSVK